MTPRQIQQQIADALNADATLLQGGCRAFAEDALNVEQEAARQLHEAGGVALVVLTPAGERQGGPCGKGIKVETEITVSAAEITALNRLRPDAMTALDAAIRAALLLDGRGLEFQRYAQSTEPEYGIVKTDAVFSAQVELTQK